MERCQVPENLIDQLQILLTKEASLESFNPNDPSIPPLPTLEEAVAGIGTSDDQLRCKHCKGELLRGSESIICVYCGHGRQQESPPQPIAFKSTLGFGWLLQSLQLDGSESVGQALGGVQSKREQNSLKDGMALSGFLNLDLKWPDEAKRFGMINESLFAGERPSTLVGVALSELFPEGNRANASSADVEQIATSKKLEPKEADRFGVEKSPNLFEDTRSAESVLKSNEDENGESFSGWEAEFQSAVPDAGLEHMYSFEAAEVPPTNNGSYINSVQGYLEVEKYADISSSYAHPTNNITNDNLDLKFALHSHSEQSETSILVEDVGLKPVDASSGLTWPLDDPQKTAVADLSLVKSGLCDDSFDAWNDFRSSTDVDNNHSEPSTATPSGTEKRGLDIYDGWNDFTESAVIENNQPKTNIVSGLIDDSLDVWNVFTAGDIKLQTLGSEVHQQEKQHDLVEFMLGGNDLASLNAAQQDGQGIRADASQNKTFSQNDSVGFWSTGISMTVLDDQLLGSETQSTPIETTKEADDSFKLWNNFKSSTIGTEQVNSVKEADNQISVKDDKTSDIWDNFASVGAAENEQQISGENAINGSLWTDNSFNAWNVLTGSSAVSVSKPSSNGNDTSFGEWNDFSSSDISHPDQLQTSGRKAAAIQTVLEDDDALSSWSNLRSLETQVEDSFPSTIVTESSQGQISTGQASESLKVMDSSPFDTWVEFGHSVLLPDKKSQAGGEKLSENKQTDDDNDFFSGWIESGKQSANLPDNQVNGNGVMAHGGKSISENEDSFDAWTGYTSSTNVPDNQSISNSANEPVDEEAVKHDDIFDSWNVFASSTNVEAGNNTTAPKENIPQVSLLSTTTYSEGLEYDKNYQQDLFLRVTSDQNGSSQEGFPPSEVPDLVWTENGRAIADYDSAKINQIETTGGTSDPKPSYADTLISEMHALSFMLENSLSIPKTKGRE